MNATKNPFFFSRATLRTLSRSILALALVLTGTGGPAAAQGAPQGYMQTPGTSTVYSSNFEGNDGREAWSKWITEVTPKDDRQFLGQFGTEEVVLTLKDLPAHQYLRLSFDLFLIRTWDGSSTYYGASAWALSVVGGPVLLYTTFGNLGFIPGNNLQAFPDSFPAAVHLAWTGAAEQQTLGYTATFGTPETYDCDSVYRFNLAFPHTGDQVQLQFQALKGETIKSESWGLANVKVQTLARAPQSGLPAEQMDGLWEDLGGEDPVQAYQAVWTLAGAGPKAVELLAGKLLTPRPEAETLRYNRALQALEIIASPEAIDLMKRFNRQPRRLEQLKKDPALKPRRDEPVRTQPAVRSQLAKITGLVRDPEGKPAPALPVILFPDFRPGASRVQTDATGRYELSWDPRQLMGPERGLCLVARDLTRNLAAAQDLEEGMTNLDLRLEPGLTLAGRIETSEGKPLAEAAVTTMLLAGSIGSQFGEPAKTDTQGQFEIAALPPGRRYSLYATAKGYGSANRQILSDDAVAGRLELEPIVLRIADRKLAGQVLDADDKPAAQVNVFLYGEGQPNGTVRTDNQGRFAFDAVCEGQLRLSANLQNAFASASADAGDTNVVIKLSPRTSSVAAPPRVIPRASLRGKPLPDLAAIGLPPEAERAGKPLLVCLFDAEQRPSRRCVRLLAEQHGALSQKGVAIAAAQAVLTTDEAFKAWQDAGPSPFPVGRITDKSAPAKWATEVPSLPWLILTDAAGKVSAEGFTLDELDAKLAALNK